MRLWVHPLILGRNGPRVPHFLSCQPVQMNLVSTKSLPDGITILTYQLASAQGDADSSS
jgi:hypothetical protein